VTKLLALSEKKKDQGWVSVEGIELLLEQGYKQFKIFTGRRVPKKVVRQKVLEMFEQNMALGLTR
jgi:pentafunctional AROM polypeptide